MRKKKTVQKKVKKENLFDFGVFGIWSKGSLIAQAHKPFTSETYYKPPLRLQAKKDEIIMEERKLLNTRVKKLTYGEMRDLDELYDEINKNLEDYRELEKFITKNTKR